MLLEWWLIWISCPLRQREFEKETNFRLRFILSSKCICGKSDCMDPSQTLSSTFQKSVVFRITSDLTWGVSRLLYLYFSSWQALPFRQDFSTAKNFLVSKIFRLSEMVRKIPGAATSWYSKSDVSCVTRKLQRVFNLSLKAWWWTDPGLSTCFFWAVLGVLVLHRFLGMFW